MKIVIPMAGLGTRFQKVSDQNPEYKKPKPFIIIKGEPMIKWAIASLPFARNHAQKKENHHWVEPSDLIFIILKEHDERHQIKKQLQEIYSSDIKVIVLEKVTRGAAETAYKANKYLNPEEEILITDSDHFFDGKNLADLIKNKDKDTSGIIPVFKAKNEGIPKWSYSLLKTGTNFIEKVAEKDRDLMEKGAHANILAYYFSKAKTFLEEVEDTILKNKLTGEEGKKEFYVAPIYQHLIEKGFKFQAAIIPEVWGLGTPSDLDYFLSNYKFSLHQ